MGVVRAGSAEAAVGGPTTAGRFAFQVWATNLAHRHYHRPLFQHLHNFCRPTCCLACTPELGTHLYLPLTCDAALGAGEEAEQRQEPKDRAGLVPSHPGYSRPHVHSEDSGGGHPSSTPACPPHSICTHVVVPLLVRHTRWLPVEPAAVQVPALGSRQTEAARMALLLTRPGTLQFISPLWASVALCIQWR